MRSIVVGHSILITLALLLLIFEVRVLLLVLPAVTIGHRTVPVHRAVLIGRCRHTVPRPSTGGSIVRIYATILVANLMIALPRHADCLLAVVVLMLLPGFMSAIVNLPACLVVFSGGDRRAVHICLRFVVAKNLIISRVSIHLLIWIICNTCLVRVVPTQISYTG
jgi:hypothetical protein